MRPAWAFPLKYTERNMKSKTYRTEPQGKIKTYAKHLIFIILLVGTLAVNSASRSLVESPDIAPNPLRVGEKLTYDISWKKIPAARRTDWIMQKTSMKGEDVYYIHSEMKTRSLFRVYSFQRHEETYLNPMTLSPVYFRNRLQDQKYRATVTIDFREETAEYVKLSRPKSKSPERREIKVIEIPVGTQDELSTLYFLRSKEFELGKTYFFPIITKGKVQKVTLTVERREMVKSKALGRVKTLVLQTSAGDRFWLTDDARRLPVKAESKIGQLTVKITLADVEFTKSAD